MFTGIVAEIGCLEKIGSAGELIRLEITAPSVSKQAEISDSIAVSGVCLTVVKKVNKRLYFDLVKSSLERTNLKQLKIKDLVNLEPALRVGDKLGGHFVLGHIDCVCRLRRIAVFRHYHDLEIEYPSQLVRYIIPNGSIALEGVSLTVKQVRTRSFTVSVIPFTWQHTTLQYLKPGARLNLEADYLLKRK